MAITPHDATVRSQSRDLDPATNMRQRNTAAITVGDYTIRADREATGSA
jgi:hypothetical protein